MSSKDPHTRLAPVLLGLGALSLGMFAGCERDVAEPPTEEVEEAAESYPTVQETHGTFDLTVFGDLEAELEGNSICSRLPAENELRLALHPTDDEDDGYPYFFKIAVGGYEGPGTYDGALQVDGPQRSAGDAEVVVQEAELMVGDDEEELMGPGLALSVAGDYAGAAGVGRVEGTVRCDPFEEGS